jgi:hypothetical protein
MLILIYITKCETVKLSVVEFTYCSYNNEVIAGIVYSIEVIAGILLDCN